MTSKIGVKKIQYPNGTDILTLDSSGSIAIGNSATVGGTLGVTGAATLSSTLNVTGTSTTAQIDASGSINTTANAISVTNSSYPQLQLNSGVKNYTIFNDTGSNSLYFKNNTDNVNAVVVNSSGHVTMPNQPAFAAYRNAGDVQSVTTFIYNVAVYSIGSHYNTSNGRFTAPTAGRYQFNCMMSHNGANTGNVGFFRPQINSISQSWLFPIGPNIDHYSIGMSFTLNLAVNDYVSINTGTSAQMLGSGNIHNHFSGYFVG